MGTEIKLSVLDQSPLRKGEFAAKALSESIQLAKFVEKLGYSRYWIAEHHNASSYVCTSPEILIGQIAAHTTSIRVGSGGIMLPNYPPFKVAEQFRMLESLFPGRIDLGIGRARGGDKISASALVYPHQQIPIDQYPYQVLDLIGFLHENISDKHPYCKIKVQPGPLPTSFPEIWLLGSSVAAAEHAASLGLPFAFAYFLQGDEEIGIDAMGAYYKNFKPSQFLNAPKLNLAIEIICASSMKEAKFLAESRRFNCVAEVYEIQGFLPPDEVADYTLNQELKSFIEGSMRWCIIGDPNYVLDVLKKISMRYHTYDISVLTNCYDFQHRMFSYKLLAEVFGLIKIKEMC